MESHTSSCMFVDPIMKISARGLAKMIQFLARMAKEKIIDKREFKDFQDFVKRTEGEFDVINIPVEHKKGFDENAFVVREFADLKENGVRFYEMPDLNMEDNYVQLAVSREDKELFSAWYTRYLNNKMSRGGVKTVESLKAFTDGKVSIFSVPLEGKATERAQRKVKKATGKTLPKKSVKAPAPPMKSK